MNESCALEQNRACFPKAAIAAVNAIAEQFETAPVDWQHVTGQTENYYTAHIRGLLIYIYEDECQIQRTRVDLRYESCDYANSAEQINAFIIELNNILKSIVCPE